MNNRLLKELKNRDFNFAKRFTLDEIRQQVEVREKITLDYEGVAINFFVILSPRGISFNLGGEGIYHNHPAQIHIDYNEEYRIQFDSTNINVFSDTDRNQMRNLQAVNRASAELCETLLLIDEINGLKEAIKWNMTLLLQHSKEQS